MSPRTRQALGFLVALLLLALLAWFVGPLELLRTVAGLDPAWIGLAALVFTLLFFLKALKWDQLLRMDGIHLGYAAVLATLASANASNLILPAKLGDTVRGVVVKRRGNVSFWYGMSSSILDRLLDFYSTAIVAGVALLFIEIPALPAWARASLQAAIVVGLLSGLALLSSRRFLLLADRLLLHRFHATRRAFDDLVKPIDALRRNWRLGALLVVLASFVWFMEGAVAYWVAVAAHADVSFLIVLFAVQCANLTKAVPLTPGGIGTYEAALGGVLVWGGLAPELAAAVALVDHAIKNLLTLLASLPAASYLGIRVTKPVEPETATEPEPQGS